MPVIRGNVVRFIERAEVVTPAGKGNKQGMIRNVIHRIQPIFGEFCATGVIDAAECGAVVGVQICVHRQHTHRLRQNLAEKWHARGATH